MDPNEYRVDLNAKKKRRSTQKKKKSMRKMKPCSPGQHRRKSSPRRCHKSARSKKTGRFIKQR